MAGQQKHNKTNCQTNNVKLARMFICSVCHIVASVVGVSIQPVVIFISVVIFDLLHIHT